MEAAILLAPARTYHLRRNLHFDVPPWLVHIARIDLVKVHAERSRPVQTGDAVAGQEEEIMHVDRVELAQLDVSIGDQQVSVVAYYQQAFDESGRIGRSSIMGEVNSRPAVKEPRG